jgi:large subunit ribosomal protein L18
MRKRNKQQSIDMSKANPRLRRARKTRSKIANLKAHRLSIHRTPKHIYAQVIAPTGNETIVSASTLETDVRSGLKYTGNVDAAKAVGKLVAERAKEKGLGKVAFDRSGFRFHGRVKALAEAAREAGLKF